MNLANRLAASWLLVCAGVFPALSQPVGKWPEKPVHLIVPFASGGSTDLIARQIALELSRRIGQPVIVENKAGASAMIGSGYVAKQPGDGYTLMMGTVSTHAMAPSVFSKVPYDIVRDFTPITIVGTIPDLIVVGPQFPANNLAEFIAMAKANPGKITYATAGNGTSSHLGSAYFAAEAGIDMNQVPYKGSGPALLDVMGGHVDMMLDVIMTSLEPYKAGRIKALAVTAPRRSPLLPDVPSTREFGLNDFEASIWFAILGPAGIPAALQNRIAGEINAVLNAPDMRAFLLKQGMEVEASGPGPLAALIQSDTAKWARVVKFAGIQPE